MSQSFFVFSFFFIYFFSTNSIHIHIILHLNFLFKHNDILEFVPCLKGEKQTSLTFFFFLAALGLCCCTRAFSSCSERRLLFVAVRGLLIVVASRCGEWALGSWASVVAAHRLNSCGTQTQLLCGMWNLPRPGLEPMSPALADRFLTTAPPGKSLSPFCFCLFFVLFWQLHKNILYGYIMI